jgi:Cu-Zn family superoxide dismutase
MQKIFDVCMKKYITVFLCILLVFIYIYYNMPTTPIYGIAVFDNSQIKGTVKFTEIENKVRIDLNLRGLKPNFQHGFHVHEAGDLTDKCTSMCAHFNPYKKTHGCPGKTERHVGDLGNIETNSKGEAKYTFYDNMIKLRGHTTNIIGRGLIIHEDTDDCGQGSNAESLKTGNAGKRIACAVIGYAKENFS